MTVGVDRRAMLIALVGAAVISFSPVFYVYSNTNPSTGAFFRMLYALPILGILAFGIAINQTNNVENELVRVVLHSLLPYFDEFYRQRHRDSHWKFSGHLGDFGFMETLR